MSELEQDAQPVFDVCHCPGRDDTPALGQALLRDGAHLVTLDDAGLSKTALRRRDRNMIDDPANRASQRDDHDQVCRTVVEDIAGYDQTWALAALLITTDGGQLAKPDLSARRLRKHSCRRHSTAPSGGASHQAPPGKEVRPLGRP